MKQARVQLYGITGKYVVVNLDATEGATVGKDLFWPDGRVVTVADLKPVTNTGSGLDTSDDLDEGRYNLYFTQQRAQDAVGGILTDTSTIDFTYDANGHTIKADLKVLADVGGGELLKIVRDDYGRVTGTSEANSDDLAEGSSHLYFTKARVADMLKEGQGIDLATDGDGNVTISLEPTSTGNSLTDWSGNQLTDWDDVELTDWALSAVNWEDIGNKPTTLAGFGITDGVRSIVPGPGILVDNTDPLHPKVSFDPTSIWAYQ